MRIDTLTEQHAKEIAEWRYDFPYEWYDTAADPRRVELFANPARRDGLRAVVDDDGELIGFFNFVREGDEVRVGLGIRPDLTGQGLGARFIEAGLQLRDGRVVAQALPPLGRVVERARAPRLSPRRLRGGCRPGREAALRGDGTAGLIRAGRVRCLFAPL